MNGICAVVFSHKGGVGKTTTTLTLISALAEQGYRVLAIDTDEKPDLSSTFYGRTYIESLNKINTIAALFDPHISSEVESSHLIQQTNVPNIWLVASSPLFTYHEQRDPLTQLAIREFIDDVREAFDFIFIDTPPRLSSQGTWASLLAADVVVTPVNMTKYSAESIDDTQKMIRAAKTGGNAHLRFLGYVVNNRKRGKLYDQYESDFRSNLASQMFDNLVPEMIAYAEAQHEEKCIHQYAPRAKATKIARALAQEFAARLETIGIQPGPKRRAA